MEIQIKGIHLTITPSIKEYAFKKIEKVTKYHENIQTIHIELEVAKTKNKDLSHICRVYGNAAGFKFQAEESHPDMYASVDLVSEKIEKQLKKQHEKLKSHKGRISLRGFFLGLLNADAKKSENGLSLKKWTLSKPMDPIEAAFQLQAEKINFYPFQNKLTKEINLIYLRKKNEFGLLILSKNKAAETRLKTFLKKQKHEKVKIAKIKSLNAKPMDISKANEAKTSAKSDFYLFVDSKSGELRLLASMGKKPALYELLA